MFTQLAKDLFRYTDKMDKPSVPDVSSPRSKEAQQKLVELTKHGLLNVGDKVQFFYKTREYVAQVTPEGCLLYHGENGESELFLSPSAFVNTVAKRQNSASRGRSKPKLNLNGWEFCMVAGVTLSQLKQQLEAIEQAQGTTGSATAKWNMQEKQENETGKKDLSLTEHSEEATTPVKKKQRLEEDEDTTMSEKLNIEQSQQLEDFSQKDQVGEEDREQDKQEEGSPESDNDEDDDNKNRKKRTTRLASGSIKHVNYTKGGGKQTNNDEVSSVDKTDDDKELDRMDVMEGTLSRGGGGGGRRRRRLSASTRNSSRLASQVTKVPRGKADASSDDEERSMSRGSVRHLRRERARDTSPKVVSTQEDDQLSNSDDIGEPKQENDEIVSQMTGEEDAEDLEEPSVDMFEQLTEAERMELHCGWSKEDRETLLNALKETRQLDAATLSQHMKRKSTEEVSEYLNLLKERMKESAKENELEPDISLYIMVLSLELFHTGVFSSSGAISRRLEHNGKNSVPSDSKVASSLKRTTSDADRKLKKVRKELEELRNKVEMEMAARRDLELEKQLLEVQLQEAKRATEREARKRAAVEDENEELKVRELETRRRLDRLKLKLTAVKGEPTSAETKDIVSPTNAHLGDIPKTGTDAAEEKDSVVEDRSETVSKEPTREEIARLEEEVERLRNKVASLETEVSDFQQDAENERRRNHHLMEAKKYLEVSLNEILHASKSALPDEMEDATNEQTVSDLDKSSFHSKDVNERMTSPSIQRWSSSIIARRRKSRASRSIFV